ncbi:MAG: histidine kinase, partial [Rubrivivax sp.]|nr:histidine kinase [Rubrivivax sp.]
MSLALSAADDGPSLLQPLNQPLPVELSGSGHNWFTRYRRYPVFGPAWARARMRVWLAVALPLLLLMLLPMGLDRPRQDLPLGSLVQVAVQLLLPIVLGPWLCAWVRQRGWDPAREWGALLLALALTMGTVLGFHAWAAEPIKRWLAEQVGQVDETGKRRRVVMAIGVTVLSPDESASRVASGGPGPVLEPKPTGSMTNTATSALASFMLGGGLGLLAWRRQRADLATLARERELARAQARRREAEMRLSVLAAQVEPHFLFNTLAGVRSAIRTDPARASELVDRLVDYLRAAIPRLRSDGGAEATLGGQLDLVRTYLSLMVARMPRLSFDIDAPPDLLGASCPPLMLISLAENAIKHGAEPKIGPVRVTLQARRSEDGRLAITVADDGAGFDAEGHAGGGGLGLSNIRERLLQ